MYCKYCGFEVADDAVVCPNCGRLLDETLRKSNKSNTNNIFENRGIVTLILCVILGGLGMHRFYTGNIVTGILMLLTLGGCGIWWLVDIIMIVTGSFKDGDGNTVSI